MWKHLTELGVESLLRNDLAAGATKIIVMDFSKNRISEVQDNAFNVKKGIKARLETFF